MYIYIHLCICKGPHWWWLSVQCCCSISHVKRHPTSAVSAILRCCSIEFYCHCALGSSHAHSCSAYVHTHAHTVAWLLLLAFCLWFAFDRVTINALNRFKFDSCKWVQSSCACKCVCDIWFICSHKAKYVRVFQCAIWLTHRFDYILILSIFRFCLSAFAFAAIIPLQCIWGENWRFLC